MFKGKNFFQLGSFALKSNFLNVLSLLNQCMLCFTRIKEKSLLAKLNLMVQKEGKKFVISLEKKRINFEVLKPFLFCH